MLLRASGEREDRDYDLQAITDPDTDSGVPHDRLLRALAEQTAAGQWQALESTRQEAAAAMGEQRMVDALVVASAFNGITRVADATGIPLDENTAATTGSLRESVGLDAYDYGVKSTRYG